MPTFEINKDAQEEINGTVLNKNVSIVEHQQIEKKCTKTVESSLSSNSVSTITTSATISSTKLACTSYTAGKGGRRSVVSSLCLSVERKDSSLRYLSRTRKVSSCILPAGQNTVIHLDNYTQFMAQHAPSPRTSIKRSEKFTREQDQIVSCSPTSTTKQTPRSGTKIDIGVIDVVLSGAPPYCTRQQTINMNKHKVLGKHFSDGLSFFVYNSAV